MDFEAASNLILGLVALFFTIPAFLWLGWQIYKDEMKKKNTSKS